MALNRYKKNEFFYISLEGFQIKAGQSVEGKSIAVSAG